VLQPFVLRSRLERSMSPRFPPSFYCTLLDEIEQTLALDVTPASWPIGMGRDFLGTYDLIADALLLFDRRDGARLTEPVRCSDTARSLCQPALPGSDFASRSAMASPPR
jgi:peptide subunit release factor RF-3